MAGLMLRKDKKTESWSWTNEEYRHPDLPAWLQGVWQGRPLEGLAGVSTSNRSQVDEVQYPRIPSRILKGMPYEEVDNDIISEVAMSGVGR
jgi:hypothetical protein